MKTDTQGNIRPYFRETLAFLHEGKRTAKCTESSSSNMTELMKRTLETYGEAFDVLRKCYCSRYCAAEAARGGCAELDFSNVDVAEFLGTIRTFRRADDLIEYYSAMIAQGCAYLVLLEDELSMRGESEHTHMMQILVEKHGRLQMEYGKVIAQLRVEDARRAAKLSLCERSA